MPRFSVFHDSGDEVPEPVNDPPDVDADNELPVSGGHADELGAVHRHARIVASDVELAEVALGFGQRVDYRLLLRHVDPNRQDTLVGAGQGGCRLLERFGLDVGHDHIGAGRCEGGCDA